MPLYRRILFSVLASAVIILSGTGTSVAFDDGFGSARKLSGKNTILYLAQDTDVSGLERQLDIGPAAKILAGKEMKTKDAPEEELVDMLDTLYLEVCDITDMRLPSLQIDIKVCRDQGQLDSIYDNLFKSSLGGRKSFYVYSLNSIYVSADSFTKEVIGHEMAHAVICHYFVVPPSVKIQEVLAMYVEYNLRKPNR